MLRDVPLLNPRRVVFTGGEPLLRQDILKMAQALRNEGDGIRLCIITNGTLMNKDDAKNLAEEL